MLFLGGGCFKTQLPLSHAAVTNNAKLYGEQDIPVPRETETKKLKAARFSVKSVNPFSKAALRGVEIIKKCTGKGLVKKYWGGGPEQRGGGSSVFEPLVRGGSFNFQLPHRGGSSFFFMGISTI